MLTRYSSNTDKEMVVLKMEDLDGAELGLIRYSVSLLLFFILSGSFSLITEEG